MIEPLLEAERAMSFGLIDQAERLYRQVADHDPRSSIAVVGLARVALERGDERTAYVEATRATRIDPENPAAQHLVMRLTEVYAARGEPLPATDPAGPAATASTAAAMPHTPPPTSAAASAAPEGPPPTPAPAPRAADEAPPSTPARGPRPAAPPATAPRPRKRRSLVDRLLGRSR